MNVYCFAMIAMKEFDIQVKCYVLIFDGWQKAVDFAMAEMQKDFPGYKLFPPRPFPAPLNQEVIQRIAALAK